jgi:hypothetical protein
MLQAFYLDVAYVLQLFSSVFRSFASVSDTYFKCFICFQMYVTSVVSGCFKSRLGVASLFSLSTASPWYLLTTFCYLASFLDYGGRATRAGEGGAPGADGRDTTGDCGTDMSAQCSLLLRGALRSPLVFYFYAGYWDGPISGPRHQPTIRLAGNWEMRPDTLWVPDVWALVPCIIIYIKGGCVCGGL